MNNFIKALSLGATVVGTFVAAILIGYYTNQMVIGIISGAVLVMADILTMALKKK